MATSDPFTNAPQGRVLIVTNDFPPTLGGIQTYIRDYAATLDPARLVVFASTQDARRAAEFDATLAYPVIRSPRSVLLPTPATIRQMQAIIRERSIDTVWFGAAAPLAVMARWARAAGARRIVASTHGHEIGWSMLPGARSVLKIIGRDVDCLTYVSRYARNRLVGVFGPTVAWEPMPGGVDTTRFAPDPAGRARIRALLGLPDDPEQAPLIVAISRLVPRKGQDTLIRALPLIRGCVPGTKLLLVGPGDYRERLSRLAAELGVGEDVIFTGGVELDELPAYYNAGDVFALPVRTQLGGLSVEGLGIVFLEAQACGIPTVAGDGGGAPETVRDGETGVVVPGREIAEVAERIAQLLGDAPYRDCLAAAGRRYTEAAWSWEILGQQCEAVMAGDGRMPPRHSWSTQL